MAQVASRLLPDATIEAHHINASLNGTQIRDRVVGADLVVTNIANPQNGPASMLSVAGLGDSIGRGIHLPAAIFTGFHPDMFYLTDRGEPIDGAISQYHSRIALGGFLAGLDVARTVRLFNAHVFAELGYFAAYAIAERQMLRTYQRQGLHLGATLRRWRQRGTIFMHTINHPTIALLERLTVMTLAHAGLTEATQRPLGGLDDVLANGVIAPVFPTLARRLQVAPSVDYLQPTAWVAPGEGRQVTLPDYVDRSFARYRTLDRDILSGSVARPDIARLDALLA